MKDLTRGNEAKLIFFFSLPMLIGNLFQQLYTTVDSVIVGRFIGSRALAAVGAGFPIIFLVVSLVMGVTIGITVLIAQYYGAKSMKKLKRAIETSLIFLFFASLAVTALGLSTSGLILRLMKTPAVIFSQARDYIDIMFAGALFMFGYNALSAILRGLGDSKTPLVYLIIANILNVGLDLLFVVVFRWGVRGSAWATILSQACAFFIALYHLGKKHELFQFNIRHMVFDRKIFFTALRIGLPTGVRNMLVALGFIALISIVNGFGASATAAFTAASRIDSFAGMPAMNLSMALATFTGQNIGARMVHRVKKGFIATFVLSGVISLFITLAAVFLGPALIAFFTTDPEVIHIGSRYLLIVGGFYIFFSAMFVTNGLLTGAGQTLIPMFSTILGLWAVRIPVAALLSRSMGTDGIWLGMPLAWLVGLALSFGYYLTGRWKHGRSLAHLAEEPLEYPYKEA